MKKVIFIFLLFLATGCAQKINAPSPQLGAFKEPPQAKESLVLIPLSVNISEIQQFVNEKLPSGRIHQESGRDGNTKRWRFEIRRDQPIGFTALNDELIFRLPIRVNAHGSYTACIGFWRRGRCCSVPGWGGGCAVSGVTETEHGDASVDVEVLFKAKLKVNPDYTLGVTTFLDASVIGNPHLTMDLIGNLIRINISIKDEIEGPLQEQIARVKPEIDKKIAEYLAEFKIRSQLAGYWEKAKEPIAMDAYWLNISPEKVYFENLNSNGKQLFITVGAGARLQLSDDKLPISGTPLPDLSFTGNQPGMFRIDLPARLSFEKLTAILNKQFAGKIYSQGKAKVRIKELELKGIQLADSVNGLLAKVSFKGSRGFLKRIKGSLYFTAVPAFDQEMNTLFMAGFKLTPETNNLLINKGLPWLVDNFYYEDIKDKLQYDFTSDLDKYTTLLKEEMDTVKVGDLIVHGRLDNLAFEGFYINEDFIHLLVNSGGTLQTEPIPIITTEPLGKVEE